MHESKFDWIDANDPCMWILSTCVILLFSFWDHALKRATQASHCFSVLVSFSRSLWVYFTHLPIVIHWIVVNFFVVISMRRRNQHSLKNDSVYGLHFIDSVEYRYKAVNIPFTNALVQFVQYRMYAIALNCNFVNKHLQTFKSFQVNM